MQYTSTEYAPNIAFAGLTAAGKTTHAKILAEQLGFEYISATKTILEIIGLDHEPERIWFTSGSQITMQFKKHATAKQLI